MTSSENSKSEILPDAIFTNEQIGEFIFGFMQALLRAGYYFPDHPEAQEAISGLYRRFQILTHSHKELAFIQVDDHGHRTIVVESGSGPPIKISKTMSPGMIEAYLPRFMQFINRKELIALTLNARMCEEEFSHFIDVMSGPVYNNMQGLSAKDSFLITLQQRKIYNVSFVFREDFIQLHNHLPWRARLALSRLKKDLYSLPILRTPGDAELHQIKLQTLSDVLHPLGSADLFYPFIMNLDLAASPLLTEEDAEYHALSFISDHLLLSVGEACINNHFTSSVETSHHITPQKKARIIGLLCHRLNTVKTLQAETMLETLFDNSLVTLENLSEHLKQRVLTIKRLKTYLSNPVKFLRAFDMTEKPDVYRLRAATLISFLPYLVERGRLDEAIIILRMINYHIKENSERSATAISIRSEVVFGLTLKNASILFLSASKEIRTSICTLFYLLGHGSVPYLQNILIASNDLWRSKQAADTLVALGNKSIKSLISAINCTIFSDISISVVLRVLSHLNESPYRNEIVDILIVHTASKNSDICLEALAGLCRINPPAGFNQFKIKSKAREPDIKKISICGIGLAGDRRGFDILSAIIEKAMKSGSEEDLIPGAQAIRSMGALAESCQLIRTKIYTYLGEMTDRCCSRWNQIIPGTATVPKSLLLALADTIGKQQGPAMRQYMVKLSSHYNQEVAKYAIQILNR